MADSDEPLSETVNLEATNTDVDLSTNDVAENTTLVYEDVGPSLEEIETAKAHIAHIRSEKGLDTGSDELGPNAADLEAALNVLSDQLYAQPTHFLLEFIQNADDNTYADDVLPSISFNQEPGELLIRCNETGFQPKNIEAICRIAHSTKKDRSQGFIGEKGIGFKSVFKIADIVHIASNAYTFKFDRNGPLGMIAPIWSPFPMRSAVDATSFLLYLTCDDKKDKSEQQLRTQLRRFDSTLILFLRKLKEIRIALHDGSGTVGGRFEKVICREDTVLYGGEMIRVWGDHKRLRRLQEDNDYLVMRHTAKDMPSDNRRKGMITSEVVLAFPFKNDRPTFFKQKAYAFLPVRQSGYRFLLHADFLLIANREDLEGSNPWNEHLLWALAQCFVKAVQRFNGPEAGIVRYAWPGFLQDLPVPVDDDDGEPLALLGQRIITALKMHNLFETQEGIFVKANQALFVPPLYRGLDGHFVLPGRVADKQFIMSDYELYDPGQAVLKQLGVQMIDAEHFLRMLRHYISTDFESYTAQEDAWHSTLAGILQQALTTAQLRSLKIIPLSSGEWVSANEHLCHFETADSKAGLSKLPVGIEDLKIVAAEATNDFARRKLLQDRLGVKDLDRVEVCRLLIRFHGQEKAPDFVEIDDLVTHAKYLFEVSREGKYTFAKNAPFWVYDRDHKLRRAATMYRDDPTEGVKKMSELLPVEKWSSMLLHESYADQYSGVHQQKWKLFLENSLEIRSHTRLMNAEGKFSAEFDFMVQQLPTNILLDILFSSYMKDKRAKESKLFKDMMGAVEVSCVDGLRARLSKTCLRTRALVENAPEGVSFVDLNNPSDTKKWEVLADFGVVVKPDLAYSLLCLKLVQGRTTNICKLKGLYSMIDKMLWKDPEQVRQYFKDHAAIFIPPKESNLDASWVKSSQCCWDPTPGVTGEIAIARLYPELRSFFFDHLQVRSATIKKVAEELRSISYPAPSGELRRRKALILSLADFVHRHETSLGSVDGILRNLLFMPLAGKYGMESTQLASLNKSVWYFADRHEYVMAFQDHTVVNLAGFAVEDYPRLEALDRAAASLWGLPLRCISANVAEERKVGGASTFSAEVTALLRGKLKHLRRVMRHFSCPSVSHKFAQLHRLKVYHAPQLILKLSLKGAQLDSIAVEGRPLVLEAMHKPLKEHVEFYLTSLTLTSEVRRSLAEEFYRFCQVDRAAVRFLIFEIFSIDNDAKIWDILARDRITGHEEHPYVPLPVDTEYLVLPTQADTKLPSQGAIIAPTAPIGPRSQAAQEPVRQENIKAAAVPHKLDPEAVVAKIPATKKEPTVPVLPSVDKGSKVIMKLGSTLGSGEPLRELVNLPARGNINRTVHASVESSQVGSDTLRKYMWPNDARPSSSESNDSSKSFAIGYQSGDRHDSSSLSSIFLPSADRVATIKSEADQCRELDIGARGELYVYKFLVKILGEHDFDWRENWTSELRVLAGKEFTKWTPANPDTDYADFTVLDSDLKLVCYLEKALKLDLSATCGDSTTWHIEVKTTAAGPDETFHLSSKQMEMAEDMTFSVPNPAKGDVEGEADDIFVIFRVFNIDRPSMVGINVYVDPVNMLAADDSDEEDETGRDGATGAGALSAWPEAWIVRDNTQGRYSIVDQ